MKTVGRTKPEARYHAPPDKAHDHPGIRLMRNARAAVSTFFFVNGFAFASWVPHIPAVKDHHNLNDAELGGVLLAMAVGAVIALPLAGAWVASRGSRIPTILAGLGFCLALPTPLLAPNVALLGAALVLFGALNALLDVSMNAQAVQVERQASRAIMSSFRGLFSLGGLIGAAATGAALGAGMEALQFALMVAAAGVIAVVLACTGLLACDVDKGQGSGSQAFAWPSAALLGLGLLAFAGLMLEGAMADWTAVYLRDSLQASPGLAAGGFAAFSGCMAAGRFAGDAWVNRWGAIQVFRVSGLVAGLGLALAMAAQHAWLSIAGFGLVGLGASNIVPILFSAAGRTEGQAPGRALAAVATTGYLGFLTGPPIIGWIAELAGMRGALGLLALACIAMAWGAPACGWSDALEQDSVIMLDEHNAW